VSIPVEEAKQKFVLISNNQISVELAQCTGLQLISTVLLWIVWPGVVATILIPMVTVLS